VNFFVYSTLNPRRKEEGKEGKGGGKGEGGGAPNSPVSEFSSVIVNGNQILSIGRRREERKGSNRSHSGFVFIQQLPPVPRVKDTQMMAFRLPGEKKKKEVPILRFSFPFFFYLSSYHHPDCHGREGGAGKKRKRKKKGISPPLPLLPPHPNFRLPYLLIKHGRAMYRRGKKNGGEKEGGKKFQWLYSHIHRYMHISWWIRLWPEEGGERGKKKSQESAFKNIISLLNLSVRGKKRKGRKAPIPVSVPPLVNLPGETGGDREAPSSCFRCRWGA